MSLSFLELTAHALKYQLWVFSLRTERYARRRHYFPPPSINLRPFPRWCGSLVILLMLI